MLFYLVIHSIIISLLCVVIISSGDFSASELIALEDLYDATRGEYWTWNNNTIRFGIPWNFSQSAPNPCIERWQGVHCTTNCSILQTCYVEELVLRNFHLNGTLPSTIGSFQYLAFLDLRDNLIQSSIPADITLLSNLLFLSLDRNKFTSSLPDNVGDLQHLITLSLNENKLSKSIPSSIAQLTRLEALLLSRNELTGTLPSNLSNLTALKILHLNRNLFVGTLPASYYSLTSLEDLVLRDNKLYGSIPVSYSTLSNVITFDVSLNQLTGTIPDNFGVQMTKLTILFFWKNQFHGQIPCAIGNMKSLEYFNVQNNNFTGTLCSSWSNLVMLREMVFSNNEIGGTIPSNLFTKSWTQIHQLEFGFNMLEGSIPESIGNLQSLKIVDFAVNLLDGKFPDIIWNMTQLENIDISNNHVSGTFSPLCAQLVNLWKILLPNNAFHGTIPNEITELNNVAMIGLSSNHFEGTIPEKISRLSDLNTLLLDFNQFTGTVPVSMINLTKIISLATEFNYFHGPVFSSICSNEINQYQNLEFFTILHNFFSGTIPQKCTLQSVNTLQICSNFFTGPLDGLSNMHRLVVLNVSNNLFTQDLFLSQNNSEVSIFALTKSISTIDISSNQLEGIITNAFTEVEELTVLNLKSNRFSGPLTNLTPIHDRSKRNVLTVIDVSDNQFTGTLPSELFVNRPFLLSLAAVRNCLTGSIPESICQSTDLQTIALDGLHTADACQKRFFHYPNTISSYQLTNRVTGSIPDCLWKMNKLKTLHLSGNGIQGTLPDDLPLSTEMTQLSLSYNEFTGTIPARFQLRNWTVLDLGFNKFTGQLLSVSHDVPIIRSLQLSVNRLSGDIPIHLSDVNSLNILEGNLFSCKQGPSNIVDSSTGEIPGNDANADSFSCGTNTVDDAFLLFALIASFFIFVAILLFVGRKYSQHFYVGSLTYPEWWEQCYQDCTKIALDSFSYNSTVKQDTGNQLKVLQLPAICVTMFAVLILLPLYCILSTYFASHDNSYSWTASIAYKSGIVPASILFVTIVVGVWLFYHSVEFLAVKTTETNATPENNPSSVMFNQNSSDQCPSKENIVASSNEMNTKNVSKNKSKLQSLREWWSINRYYLLGGGVFVIINIIVVLTVNIVYVDAVSQGIAVSKLAALSFAVSVFKILWTNIIVLELFPWFLQSIHLIVDSCSTSANIGSSNDKSETNQSTLSSSTRIMLLSRIIVFNKIIAPFLANIFFESNCFYYVIHSPLNLTVLYNLVVCKEYYITSLRPICFSYGKIFHAVTYSPPFEYSYQCSSSLLHDFITVFVYHYLITGLSVPIRIIFMCWIEKQSWYIAIMTNKQKSVSWRECCRLFPREESNPAGDVELQSVVIVNPLSEKSTITDNNVVSFEEHTDKFEIDTCASRKSTNNQHLTVDNTKLSDESMHRNESYLINYIGDMSVLLTFGWAFPPLGLLICISMLLNSMFIRYLLKKDALSTDSDTANKENQKKDNPKKDFANETEENTQSSATDSSNLAVNTEVTFAQNPSPTSMEEVTTTLLHPLIQGLTLLTSCFFAFFLFDILGDQVGAVNACWIVITMGLLPLWLTVLVYIYSSIKRMLQREYWK